MTSKTFKSELNPTELEVSTYTDSQVVLAIGYEDGEDLGVVYLAPSDAPALALAILEAAGVAPVLHAHADFGSREQVEYLTYGLKKHVEALDHITAEAEEQAELEDEALGFANEFHGTDWDFFPCSRTTEVARYCTSSP